MKFFKVIFTFHLLKGIFTGVRKRQLIFTHHISKLFKFSV